jgi:hypothetical protein
MGAKLDAHNSINLRRPLKLLLTEHSKKTPLRNMGSLIGQTLAYPSEFSVIIA